MMCLRRLRKSLVPQLKRQVAASLRKQQLLLGQRDKFRVVVGGQPTAPALILARWLRCSSPCGRLSCRGSARAVRHGQGSYSGERGAAREWAQLHTGRAWAACARPPKMTSRLVI